MDKETNNKVARALGIPVAEQAALDRGNEHEYLCRCDTCREWWRLMGPEDELGLSYGPFTAEEIAEARPVQKPKDFFICEHCDKRSSPIRCKDGKQICNHCLGKEEGTPVCVECGLHCDPVHCFSKGSVDYENRLCFDCTFWSRMIRVDGAIRVGGKHYQDGGRKGGNKSWLGFGGAEWLIVMNDGREISTNNLWHQGTIPEHFRDRMPDNAIFRNDD